MSKGGTFSQRHQFDQARVDQASLNASNAQANANRDYGLAQQQQMQQQRQDGINSNRADRAEQSLSARYGADTNRINQQTQQSQIGGNNGIGAPTPTYMGTTPPPNGGMGIPNSTNPSLSNTAMGTGSSLNLGLGSGNELGLSGINNPGTSGIMSLL